MLQWIDCSVCLAKLLDTRPFPEDSQTFNVFQQEKLTVRSLRRIIIEGKNFKVVSMQYWILAPCRIVARALEGL